MVLVTGSRGCRWVPLKYPGGMKPWVKMQTRSSQGRPNANLKQILFALRNFTFSSRGLAGDGMIELGAVTWPVTGAGGCGGGVGAAVTLAVPCWGEAPCASRCLNGTPCFSGVDAGLLVMAAIRRGGCTKRGDAACALVVSSMCVEMRWRMDSIAKRRASMTLH